MEREYLVIVEGGQNGESYSAYSPDVDGCVATGSTLGECIDTMRIALRLHFESIARHGEEIPEGSSGTAVYLSIPIPELEAEPMVN